MSLPIFFYEQSIIPGTPLVLDEVSSKHIIQVLRMKPHEQLQLTDGKGNLYTAEIVNDHKKKCEVKVQHAEYFPPDSRNITIAISLLKNSNRFEWFLEKATEIGITEIIPLLCERTEKQHFRYDRMKNILTSAMLQSQQCWLPLLQQPQKFADFLSKFSNATVYKFDQKFIAHCIEQKKRNLSDLVNADLNSQIILIGPEGDFTKDEVDMAIQHHFLPVMLGKTRLRAETAGVVAASIIKIME